MRIELLDLLEAFWAVRFEDLGRWKSSQPHAIIVQNQVEPTKPCIVVLGRPAPRLARMGRQTEGFGEGLQLECSTVKDKCQASEA